MERNQALITYTHGLSEDEVKRAFVPFLKEFYRYRYQYQSGSVEAEFDNVSDEGYVADGMMRFKKDDGTAFTCTYEATSRDKSGEVKYTLNVPYFLWDCAAFAGVLTAAVYVALFASRFLWLASLRWNGNLGLLLGCAMLGFFGWYFMMQRWRKYRYIYAVEQFKRYQADEQWIAVAEDVFPSPIDPYLVELKNQCVYNGFGLAVVTAENGVRPLATPSRLEIYGKDRHIAHWVTRTGLFQSVATNVNVFHRYRPRVPDALHVAWNKIWRPVDYLLVGPVKRKTMQVLTRPFGGENAILDQFMASHSVQKWVLGSALLVISGLAWRVLRFHPVEQADLEALRRWQPAEQSPEDEAYSLSHEDQPLPYGSDLDQTRIPKQYPVPRKDDDLDRRSGEEEEGNVISLSSGAEDEESSGNVINLPTDEEPRRPAVTTSSNRRYEGVEDDEQPAAGRHSAVAPACGGLAGKSGWVIVDGIFTTRGQAEARLAALREGRIGTAAVAPRECVDAQETGFVVWLGQVQVAESVARVKVGEYERLYDKKGVKAGRLLVLPLYGG